MAEYNPAQQLDDEEGEEPVSVHTDRCPQLDSTKQEPEHGLASPSRFTHDAR